MMWLMRMMRRRRRQDTDDVNAAKERLDRARADDSTVDRLVARRARLTRENGLARDIERALRVRRT